MSVIGPTDPLMSRRTAASELAAPFGGNASGSAADTIGPGVIDANLAAIQGQLDAASLVATQYTGVDSLLDSMTNLLNDASTLTLASATNTLSDVERQANQTQMDSIIDTINRLGSNPNINSNAWIKLGDLTADDIGTISIGSADFFLSDVGSGGALNLLDGNISGAALSIDQAINDISDMREAIGSFAQGSEAEQYILLNSEIELSSSLSAMNNFADAMETSRQVRAQLLAGAGNGATGFGGAYQGGILSLLG